MIAKMLIKCFVQSPTVSSLSVSVSQSVQSKVNDEMRAAIVVWRQLLMSPVLRVCYERRMMTQMIIKMRTDWNRDW